jgi:hypothetical protein
MRERQMRPGSPRPALTSEAGRSRHWCQLRAIRTVVQARSLETEGVAVWSDSRTPLRPVFWGRVDDEAAHPRHMGRV